MVQSPRARRRRGRPRRSVASIHASTPASPLSEPLSEFGPFSEFGLFSRCDEDSNPCCAATRPVCALVPEPPPEPEPPPDPEPVLRGPSSTPLAFAAIAGATELTRFPLGSVVPSPTAASPPLSPFLPALPPRFRFSSALLRSARFSFVVASSRPFSDTVWLVPVPVPECVCCPPPDPFAGAGGGATPAPAPAPAPPGMPGKNIITFARAAI
mmetsp:Transcript_3776/g.16566  ORF Transcript_3776/g.16566 Transcript_3776/m.16566 type:complete len:212 (-) Transcript_3776:1494-2129(-)